MSNRRDVQAIAYTTGCAAIVLALIAAARLWPMRPDAAAWLVWLRVGAVWLAIAASCNVYVWWCHRAFSRRSPDQ